MRLDGEVVSDPRRRDRRPAGEAQPRQEEARAADCLAAPEQAPPPRRARTDRGTVRAAWPRVAVEAAVAVEQQLRVALGDRRQLGDILGRGEAERLPRPTGGCRGSRPGRAAADPPRRCGSRRWSRASGPAAPGRLAQVPGRGAAGRRSCPRPRPTRPRSWWSWARPKRSAPSTIISVALGTSTPTSITVVATSTRARRPRRAP